MKIVICLLMEKKSLNLKPAIKMLTFQQYVVLEVCLMDLVLLSLEKYDFSVDYSSIDKFDFLNIHKYLIIKNSI